MTKFTHLSTYLELSIANVYMTLMTMYSLVTLVSGSCLHELVTCSRIATKHHLQPFTINFGFVVQHCKLLWRA